MSDVDFRRACVVTGVGLAVQLGAALHWTPATFILAAAIGTPLVLLGGAMFLRAVWRFMKERGAA
jgi:hypothetical protein